MSWTILDYTPFNLVWDGDGGSVLWKEVCQLSSSLLGLMVLIGIQYIVSLFMHLFAN